MKKSTKLLTASLILGAALSGVFTSEAYGSISPIPPTQSLMDCAHHEFRLEYPDEPASYPLTDEQLAKIKSITECYSSTYNAIDDMSGLEKMTSLETFNHRITNISSIDFSNSPNLKEVYLRGTSINEGSYQSDSILSSLNLSNNLKLETLHLFDNPIEFLDLSNNSELKDFITDNNPLVETGITPKKDGDKLVYNLSSLKFLTPSEDGTLTFLICDNIDCDNGHITYDEENMLLYVDNLEAIGGEVQTFRCLLELCQSPFRLKLNEPKEEPEEDTLLSPDTGSFTENLSAANMTFPAIGIILGALAAGLLSYKKIKIKE